ncbi:hypothetical protein THTE_1624 [Thermogutta terrifontis]|uniref:Uncharacterized protein n=1 Tax=Thermogutta terrifontis TaxID=1331910 RepID=A0A286RE50_9BACT|nr:hypothetical protein THTE_1624 [Thermogutta terrifontis]
MHNPTHGPICICQVQFPQNEGTIHELPLPHPMPSGSDKSFKEVGMGETVRSM